MKQEQHLDEDTMIILAMAIITMTIVMISVVTEKNEKVRITKEKVHGELVIEIISYPIIATITVILSFFMI